MPTLQDDAAKEAWKSGLELGELRARVDGHETQLRDFHGSFGQLATEMAALTRSVNASIADSKSKDEVAAALVKADERRAKESYEAAERLRVAASAEDDAKRKALKIADDERAAHSEMSWVPWARGMSVVIVLIMALNLYANLKGVKP